MWLIFKCANGHVTVTDSRTVIDIPCWCGAWAIHVGEKQLSVMRAMVGYMASQVMLADALNKNDAAAADAALVSVIQFVTGMAARPREGGGE